MRNTRTAVVGLTVGLALLAACGGSDAKSATASSSSTTTTSTTLAPALPAEQVSLQARGVLTLNDLGVGWSLKPTGVNDWDTLKKTPGLCNSPSLDTRMAGYTGHSWFEYTKTDAPATTLDLFVFVFPTVEAAQAAYANEVAVFNCANPVEPDGYRTSVAVLPDNPVGDESFYRHVDLICSDGAAYARSDRATVRRGAQLFRLGLENFSESCDNPASPDTQALFDIATKTMTKYDAERLQYTKEVYAALASTTTSTTTKKGK